MVDVPQVLELERVFGFRAGTWTAAGVPASGALPAGLLVHAVGELIVGASASDLEHQFVLRGHNGRVSCLAASSDGALLASGQEGAGADRAAPVIVWDTVSRRARFRLAGHFELVYCVAFSPDSRYVASVCRRGRLVVWDARTGDVVAGALTCNKGDDVAAASATGVCWVSIGDTNKRTPSYTLATVAQSAVRLYVMAYSARDMQYQISAEVIALPSTGLARHFTVQCAVSDGSQIVCGTSAAELCVFDVAHRVFRDATQVGSKGVVAVVPLPGRSEVVAVSGDGRVTLLDTTSRPWATLTVVQLEDQPVVAFLHGHHVYVFSATGTMYRLAASTLRGQAIAEHPVAAQTGCCFVGARSDAVWSCSADGIVYRWDLNTFRPHAVDRLRSPCTAIGATPQQQNASTAAAPGGAAAASSLAVAVGCADGSLRLYAGAGTGAPLWTNPAAHRGQVTRIVVSDAFVASGGADGCVRIWAHRTGQLLHQFQEHRGDVTGLVIDVRNPTRLHSCSVDKTILTQDVRAQKRVMFHNAGPSAPLCIAQRDAEECETLTGSADGTIAVWDIDIADAVSRSGVPGRCTALDVDANGTHVLAGTSDGELLLSLYGEKLGWTPLGSVVGHSGAVSAVAFSPDRKQVVTCSGDGTLCVWNAFL